MHFQLIALAAAFGLSLIITPLFRKLAIRVGLVDRPDANRKLHRETVALSGGVAVILSCGTAALIALMISPGVRNAVASQPWQVIGLCTSSVGIVLLGLLDDAFNIRGRQKLAGQFILVSFLVWCGFRMQTLSILGFNIDLGVFAVPIAIGWLLLTVNALNLIDGADGLCSTVGWIASAGVSAMAAYNQHYVESAIAAALAGALIGFLVFNLPPAKIFLGDAGSMLIGLLLGALALRTSLKGATAISLLGPVTILAIPIFDSGMAILRRKLTGRSVFAVDRGHLHHSLLRAGFGNRSLVIVVSLLCFVTAAGAFLGSLFNNEFIALASILTVVMALVASRVFGYAELTLLSNRLRSFSGSLMSCTRGKTSIASQQKIRLQGSRDWETVWAIVTEFAEKHQLAKVCLDLNVPWLHEGFHASWQKNKSTESDRRWTTKLPILSGGRLIGRLELSGQTENGTVVAPFNALAEMLDGLQSPIDRLCSDAGFVEDEVDIDSTRPAVMSALTGPSS